MADETTPVLGLIKPAINGDADLWGEYTNINWDTIDAAMSAVEKELASLSIMLLDKVQRLEARIAQLETP